MDSPQDTIAAIATPQGEGGIGVIRVSGAEAISIVQSIFRPVRSIDLAGAPSHTCYFGAIKSLSQNSPLHSRERVRVRDGLSPLCRTAQSHPSSQPSPLKGEGVSERIETVDQVVVTIFRSPHSYTGENVIEISAHGSPFVLNKILTLCLRQGARLAGPGEFTLRAFLNRKLDLTQAEAVADLIRSRTDKSQEAAMAQLEGRLAQKVRVLRDALLPLLAHVEVGLDHSDEEHDFLARQDLIARCRDVQEKIEELLASAQTGKILREGLRVAMVGRPNVGKSSLLNALLQEDRAIVAALPGTTRDTLEETVNWGGFPVVLTDTAGIHDAAQDPVERLGMERSRRALERADVVLCLLDSSEPLTEDDKRVIQNSLSKPHIWVVNKNDLPARWPVRSLAAFNGNAPAVSVSAKTGEGLLELMKVVKQLSLGDKAAAGETAVAINARHRDALERARGSLTQAAQAANTEAFEECVALELQSALRALGEIIGETATEELLDQIFSTFCIGK